MSTKPHPRGNSKRRFPIQIFNTFNTTYRKYAMATIDKRRRKKKKKPSRSQEEDEERGKGATLECIE